MILASCRKHFDSNQFFGSLQLRRYADLSNTAQFETIGEAELADAVADRHVLVLVHGYRNPIRNVATAYRKVETELRQRGLIGPGNYDLALGFLWPGFITRAGFFAAVPWANRSAAHFRELMKLLNSSAHTVDIQTHSLGARVALQALTFEHEVFADNLLLTAPAVDNECLEPDKEFHTALASCRRCIVYHSARDQVLRFGYVIGGLDRALGFKGPEHPAAIDKECPEVFVVNCSAVVSSHGGYRASGEVYDQWTRVMADVPLSRFETLARKK
jgi:esterase/lipase superfamily enzyme